MFDTSLYVSSKILSEVHAPSPQALLQQPCHQGRSHVIFAFSLKPDSETFTTWMLDWDDGPWTILPFNKSAHNKLLNDKMSYVLFRGSDSAHPGCMHVPWGWSS